MNPEIFREYDIRGIVGTDLDERTVSLLARAVGTFFRKHGAERIAVGYDARESSPVFAEILNSEFNKAGCDVTLIGRVPTPVLYHTVHTKDVDGGVMITGSHNPPDHNGFKICLGKHTLFGSQIREILEISRAGEFSRGDGNTSELDVLEDYRRDILSRISCGDKRLKAVVDAGNGMGGVTAVPIYRDLGIELVKLFTEPDPAFPNHHPDPTVEENLKDVIGAVASESADLGIAFDGDGDRIGIIDENGEIIWGDRLMVLLSREVLREHPGATIIGEVKCSQTLFDDISKRGGTPLMWKAGHSLIKAKMKETGSVLAGEMSGHIFFADRFYGFDDAAYAGARVLEILSRSEKTLSELLSDLPETFSTPEIRVPCEEGRKFEAVKRVAGEFSSTNEVITTDGARILFDGGWGLVRASNTQAILVLRFEAESESLLNEISGKVTSLVESYI